MGRTTFQEHFTWVGDNSAAKDPAAVFRKYPLIWKPWQVSSLLRYRNSHSVRPCSWRMPKICCKYLTRRKRVETPLRNHFAHMHAFNAALDELDYHLPAGFLRVRPSRRSSIQSARFLKKHYGLGICCNWLGSKRASRILRIIARSVPTAMPQASRCRPSGTARKPQSILPPHLETKL